MLAWPKGWRRTNNAITGMTGIISMVAIPTKTLQISISLVLLAVMLLPITGMSQSRHSINKTNRKEQPQPTYPTICQAVLERYTDSLKAIREEADSLMTHIDVSQRQDLLRNPYYFPLFVSPMLYRATLKQRMEVPYQFGETARLNKAAQIGLSLEQDQRLKVNHNINAFLADLYVEHPNLVSLTDSALEKQKSVPLDIAVEQQYRNTVSQKVAPAKPIEVIEPIVAVSRKPNFWKFTGKVSLKMMQNYNSNNWYQGAVNNSSALWKSFFTMNYNNKEKFHWDNSLEFNLGFQSDRNDKKHKYKTNTDLLRIINSVGLQASGHWYYSASLTSWTQVYPKYNNNSDYVYSDFMSPFESVLSLGMEYKKSAKRWNINVKPSPLSYDFKYCDRRALYSRYGIRGNKHTQDKFGSSLTCTFNWQILDELSWRSYLYTYTNYKSSLVQWENTFSFKISKHLSTDVFIYPRFDDSYHSSKSDAKIQLREYISLGFDYSF